MNSKNLLNKILVLAGLIGVLLLSYMAAGRIPWEQLQVAAGMPDLARLHLPEQSREGITASVEEYHADAAHIIFKIRITGEGQPYVLDFISLTNADNDELNTGYGTYREERDPQVMVLDMVPGQPLTEKRLDGQLSFTVAAADGSRAPVRFDFKLDLPLQPAKIYFANGEGLVVKPEGAGADSYPIYLARVTISPTFTWFHLCYDKPDQGDWMIGRDASLEVENRQVGISNYMLLNDADVGGGTKGGEAGWEPVGNYERCVKVGFAAGSEVNFSTRLTLTIPTLEKSMPEVIPPEELKAAYPRLLAQGIDLTWHTESHGAYPEWKKLPMGMSEEQAFKKFIEALGYTRQGPWIFNIELGARESSQPIFTTSTYGAAEPIPAPEEAALTGSVQGIIRSFDLGPDGRTIALATSQGVVLYDLEQMKQIRTLNETENFFNVDWSPDGKSLAAGGLLMEDDVIGQPHLIAWETTSWNVVFEPKLEEGMTDTLYGDVTWSPDGRSLATGNGYMGVTTFEVATGRITSSQDVFAGATADINWSPDGSRLTATGDMGYAIRRWKVATDEWVRLFDSRASSSVTLAWSPDGQRIASGHIGGAVCLWTAATNHCDGFIQAHQTGTFSLAWSPDGTMLATGGGIIRKWDAQTGRLLLGFGESTPSVYVQLAWADANMLVSLDTGFEDKEPSRLRVWNPETGELLLEILGDEGLFRQ